LYLVWGHTEEVFYASFRSILVVNLLIGLALGLCFLAHSYIAARYVRVRQQIKIVVLGMVAALLPLIALSILPDVLTGRVIVQPQFSSLGMVAMPIALGYAVVRHKLFDVDLVIRRGLVYGLLIALLLLGYALTLLGLDYFLRTVSETQRTAAIVLFSCTVLLAFLWARPRVEGLVDRFLYRARYDYKQSLRLVSAALSSMTDIRSLSRFAVDSVCKTLTLSGACLLLPDKTGRLVPKASCGSYADDAHLRNEVATDARNSNQYTLFPQPAPAESGATFLIPLEVRDKKLGILCLGDKLSSEEFSADDISFLFTFAEQVAIALDNAELVERVRTRDEQLGTAYMNLRDHAASLEKSRKGLEEAYLGIASSLVLAVESRDPYTRGHSERVGRLVRWVGLEMRLPDEELRSLELAARLHDIGKIGCPDSILLKPGLLTPAERAEIELHPTKSVEILRFLDFLAATFPIIRSHHEWYNGSGYPGGLKGHEIPLGACILAVVDAYDAMTSERPFRLPFSHAEAVAKLREGAGTQWDPEVVQAFVKCIEELPAQFPL